MGFKEKVESDFKYYEQLVDSSISECYFLFDKINEDDEERITIEEIIINCEDILRNLKAYNALIQTLTEREYYTGYSQDWEDLKTEMGDALLCLDHLITEKEKEEKED